MQTHLATASALDGSPNPLVSVPAHPDRVQTLVRLSPQNRALLERLAWHYGSTLTSVVEKAIVEYARAAGLIDPSTRGPTEASWRSPRKPKTPEDGGDGNGL